MNIGPNNPSGSSGGVGKGGGAVDEGVRPAGRDIPDPVITTAAITSKTKSSPVPWITATAMARRIFPSAEPADAARAVATHIQPDTEPIVH